MKTLVFIAILIVIACVGISVLGAFYPSVGVPLIIGLCLFVLITNIRSNRKSKRENMRRKALIYTRFPVLQQQEKENQLTLQKFLKDWDYRSAEYQKWTYVTLFHNLTLLHIMAGIGDTGNCLTLMLAGADSNAKDDNGLTPLDYAKKFNETEVIELLEKLSKSNVVTMENNQ